MHLRRWRVPSNWASNCARSLTTCAFCANTAESCRLSSFSAKLWNVWRASGSTEAKPVCGTGTGQRPTMSWNWGLRHGSHKASKSWDPTSAWLRERVARKTLVERNSNSAGFALRVAFAGAKRKFPGQTLCAHPSTESLHWACGRI